MGSPDTVPAILPPYSREFTLWENEGKTYKQHDLVPKVGMADTYAVLLDMGEPGAWRFLTVQENRITNLMAHQPIDGRSVFDPRGKYLGPGGSELDATPRIPLEKAVSMVEAATQTPRNMRDPLAEAFSEPPSEEVECHLHRFWLREDLEIKIKLPLDLTDEEAERVAVFVTTLPLAARKER